MNRLTLLLRNLRYFRAANLAVIAGMAVATAVLAGAMMVGDSVKGSLRELTLQRLGPVDYALISNRFFDQSLATRLASAKGFGQSFSQAVPAISLRGGAVKDKAKAGDVQILSIGKWVTPPPDHAIINASLADELSYHGGGLDLLLPIVSDEPREAALAQRGLNYLRTRLSLQQAKVDDARDMVSLFNLAGGQRPPLNAWVNLTDLQRELHQDGNGIPLNSVNLLVVHAKTPSSLEGEKQLNDLLHSVIELSDYGLDLKKDSATGDVVLTSRSTYIPPAVLAAAQAIATESKIDLHPVSVYLINHLTRLGQDTKTIHYLMAAGIDSVNNQPVGDDHAILNQFAADQLGAKVGDQLRLEYYQREPNGDFHQVQSPKPLRISRIIPTTGIGADPLLTPEYKGLTDAQSISTWQKPAGLDIDTRLVTPADEQYWDKYRAAPKLFLSLKTAGELWSTPYGQINSIRVPADRADEFRQALLQRLSPADMGMAFVAIKHRQIEAASQGTDFAGLFIGFSFFLITAALILVAMLFRLGIEQRARQFGLMGAVGFAPGSLLRLALGEGLILAAIGGTIGIALGVGYTWLMMVGLRTWWLSAVGTTAMRLHVFPETLAGGLIAGILVAMLAVLFAAWRLRKADAATLLAGGWGQSYRISGKRRVSLILGIIGILGTAGLLAMAFMPHAKAEEKQYMFLGGGTLLLVALLAAISNRMGRNQARAASISTSTLGIRNAARHRGRSIMTIALVAFASFSLVVVAAFKEGPPANVRETPSGTGGFPLILTSDVPILGDLNTVKGRDLDGIRNPSDPIWAKAKFVQLQMWAGQDASCLNMTRPTSPTILGISPALLADRFNIDSSASAQAMEKPLENNVVPIVADAETAQYILHIGPGQPLPIIDQTGQKRDLQLVGTLGGSIFQSQVLMDVGNFRRLFPSQSGFNVVLIDAPDDVLPELRKNLAEELGDFSITIESTGQRLARYREVANTYLSTFRVLGSLGLLLGTIGLAVILLRSLVERRSELSLLSALGFDSAQRTGLVLSENAFLLVAGLLAGTISAFVAILPAVAGSHRTINATELLLTLLAILVFGLLVLAITTRFAGRGTTAADLRHE